ncbi:MAG: 4'-phosphopantetheinyl transferase superfamily protein [Desulfosarcina sp.]|nr:4'-phosphopantetheinyl transferase superfamily protein [Desulfosarcina sp.]MBC2743890.1 4'-phosphopantetheinyl transferase superfamily protein [Desulfosarcina sp.]MBC2766799.1 4'-phosphopantetheinyl transferase superfamily protein [Desulfosarcina sp.]
MMETVTTIYPVILPVSEADRRLKGRDKVKALSRLARFALMKSCEKSGLRLDDFPKNEKGVPLPVGGVHWSLTHKSDIAGGVAATLPVGMDLETIRPVSDALLAKVANDDEWQLAHGDRQKTFFRFWTAKEAVLKAVGKGMAGLSRCRVVEIVDDTRMMLTYDETRWPVAHFWFDGHVAALTPHHCEVSWTLIP